MKAWLKSFYSRSMQWTTTKWSGWALFACAFADASFLPLPTPLFFLTLTLLNITKAYRYALSGTLGTLAGAVAGYAIGHFAWISPNGEFTGIAVFLFENMPGFSETAYNNIQAHYARWDFWILFMASIMPVPYKIFSITSGVFDINLFMFGIATLLGQGTKFYLVAVLAVKLGPGIKLLINKYYKVFAWAATACLVAGFFIFKFLI